MTSPNTIIADMQAEIGALRKENRHLLSALEYAVSVAYSAHDYWDKHQDSNVGKYLLALAGWLPGYDKRADAVHKAIEKAKDSSSC